MAAVDKKYVSAISLLDTREINPLVADVQNDEGLTDIMDLAGRQKVSKQPIYSTYVNKPLWKLGVVDVSDASAGSSTTATVTLTSATSGFARKTDLVKFPNGKVGYVTNVTGDPDTLTILSVDGTNLTAAVGNNLAFFSNAQGEKSTAPSNRRYDLTRYYNLIQLFREVNEETDVQSMSTIETTFKGQPLFAVKDLIEKFIKFKGDVNAAMIGGRISVTQFSDASPVLTDPNNSGAVQTTRGLDQYTTSYGTDDAVDSLGTWDLDDLAQLIALLLAKKAPKNYMMWIPTMAGIKVDNHLKNLASSGVTSLRMVIDGKEINMMVDRFTYGNFTFQKKALPILDHQELFVSTAIAKSAYYIPTDKVSIVGSDGTKSVEPRIQTRYMAHGIKRNAGNAVWAEWHTGALAPTGPTNDENIWRTNWYTAQGLEVNGAEHLARQTILS